MERFLITVEDQEKSKALSDWLSEQEIHVDSIDEFVASQTQSQVEEQTKLQTEAFRKKNEKKIRLLAVVSLAALLILGGLAFVQMTETDKQKELLREARKESEIHSKVVQQLQDSIIARERRYEKELEASQTADTLKNKVQKKAE